MNMYYKTIAIIILFFFSGIIYAQDVYHLWENGEIPYYKENNLKEYEEEAYGTQCVFNIVEPTLTVYKAKGENIGNAVVIIPGGGYGLVAMYHEGYDLAEKLASNGITAAVLKYRLPNPKSSDKPYLVPLTDARRALVLLKQNAEKYGFRSNRVGVVGFSAGSHLATVTSLWKSERTAENPAFTALIYGVTRMTDRNIEWLEESLYFRKMTNEEKAKNNLLELVSSNTPPTFLVHSYDDDVCNVKESTLYAEKLNENKVPVEMHLYAKGGHGFGIGRKEDGTYQWVDLFIDWVKRSVVLDRQH